MDAYEDNLGGAVAFEENNNPVVKTKTDWWSKGANLLEQGLKTYNTASAKKEESSNLNQPKASNTNMWVIGAVSAVVIISVIIFFVGRK